MSTFVRIAGNPAQVSDYAAKVINRLKIGMPISENGFGQRLAKFYPDPNAVLIESSKKLKNGKNIIQKRWSWPSGATAALTEKSDGFFSYVFKNDLRKVVKSVISRNPNHLVEKSATPKIINGQRKMVPYENHVNGENIARFIDGELFYAGNSASHAQYLVSEARKNAAQSFRCIG